MKNKMLLFLSFISLLFLSLTYILIGKIGSDFEVYYRGMIDLKAKKNIYEKHLKSKEKDKIKTLAYIYPPLFVFMCLPFSFFELTTSKFIWYFFNLIFFILTLYLCFNIININLTISQKMLIFIFAMISSPFFTGFFYGQVSLLLFLLTLLMIYFYQKKKVFLSSFFLSLAVLIKVSPLFFLIYFLIKKDLRFIICFIISLIILFLTNIAYSPIYIVKMYKIFFLQVMPTLSFPSATLANQSLGGFIARLFIPNPYLPPLFNNSMIGLIIYKSLAIIISLFNLRILFKNNIHKDLSYSFSLLVITFLIISPISWIHYYVFITFPMLFIFFKTKKNFLNIFIFVVTFLLISFVYDYSSGISFRGMKILLLSPAFYGLLGIYVLLLRHRHNNDFSPSY